MMKSLYSGVAGMKTHNQRMDVIGNNISNVNTTGYKASEVTFKDVYYQTKRGASSGDATAGGKNPTQIGYGSQLGTVTQIMAQSGFTYSDSVYNVALEGEGFFQVMDENGNIFYTRAGKFSVDSYGNLADPNGNIVLGVAGDPTGIDEGQSQRISIKVPDVNDNNAKCTKKVNGFDVTISASAPGEQGNIAFTIVDSDTPFATKTGSTLTVYLDLNQDFGGDAYADYCKAVMSDPALPASVSGSAAYTGIDATKYVVTGVYDDGTANPQYWVDLYTACEDLVNDALKTTDADGNANPNYVEAFATTVNTERSTYTEKALQEFEDALNGAIEQGGVGLEEGVIPLDVEFASLPSYDEVQALKAKNTVELSTYDENGNVTATTGLTFTADKAGEFANKYEIDLKYSSSVAAPVAKWKESTLTITMPASLGTDDAEALQKIQNAINDACNGKPDDYKITVSMAEYVDTDNTTTPPTVTTKTRSLLKADGTAFDFSSALGTKTERLGLDGGRDNFFSDLATSLSTVTMTDGRLASAQQVDDLESIRIDSDGTIYGQHAVHGLLLLGRIDIVTFENPMGLEQAGTSLWRASLASGEPQVKIGGKDGAGKVVQSALEMSNVDLAQEFSDMIITQRGYQANSRVITVSDTMLEELVNLKR